MKLEKVFQIRLSARVSGLLAKQINAITKELKCSNTEFIRLAIDEKLAAEGLDFSLSEFVRQALREKVKLGAPRQKH